MKIVSLEDVMKAAGESRVYRLLSEKNGCVSGCCSGITVCEDTEYGRGGVHDDQEGFFVLSGHGKVILGEEEFSIKEGDSFLAPAGCFHSMKRDMDSEAMKVFWFHSAV